LKEKALVDGTCGKQNEIIISIFNPILTNLFCSVVRNKQEVSSFKLQFKLLFNMTGNIVLSQLDTSHQVAYLMNDKLTFGQNKTMFNTGCLKHKSA